MKNETTKTPPSELLLPWIVVAGTLMLLIASLLICLSLGESLQEPMDEITRIKLRTLFYVLAILTFPMTNLVRHIQLKLNATMPYVNVSAEVIAKKRYLVTIIISMAQIESIGVYGLVMFILGDGLNTFYILTGLSALGLFLYRPKIPEYQQILASLHAQAHE